MKRHALGRLTEEYWPWVVTGLITALSPIYLSGLFFTVETKSRLFDKLVDVCSIGVGFWTTALALLLALESRETVEALKVLGLYSKIADYFLVTIYSFLALLVFCLLNIADVVPSSATHRVRVALWSFLLTIAATSMLRSLHLLRKLLKAR
jgi:hypothetical protein